MAEPKKRGRPPKHRKEEPEVGPGDTPRRAGKPKTLVKVLGHKTHGGHKLYRLSVGKSEPETIEMDETQLPDSYRPSILEYEQQQSSSAMKGETDEGDNEQERSDELKKDEDKKASKRTRPKKLIQVLGERDIQGKTLFNLLIGATEQEEVQMAESDLPKSYIPVVQLWKSRKQHVEDQHEEEQDEKSKETLFQTPINKRKRPDGNDDLSSSSSSSSSSESSTKVQRKKHHLEMVEIPGEEVMKVLKLLRFTPEEFAQISASFTKIKDLKQAHALQEKELYERHGKEMKVAINDWSQSVTDVLQSEEAEY